MYVCVCVCAWVCALYTIMCMCAYAHCAYAYVYTLSLSLRLSLLHFTHTNSALTLHTHKFSSDVEPIFSNLRVDEKTGEYVGQIRLGPLMTDSTAGSDSAHTIKSPTSSFPQSAGTPKADSDPEPSLSNSPKSRQPAPETNSPTRSAYLSPGDNSQNLAKDSDSETFKRRISNSKDAATSSHHKETDSETEKYFGDETQPVQTQQIEHSKSSTHTNIAQSNMHEDSTRPTGSPPSKRTSVTPSSIITDMPEDEDESDGDGDGEDSAHSVGRRVEGSSSRDDQNRRLSPQDAEVCRVQGMTCAKQGDYSGVVSHLTKALHAGCKGRAEAYSVRGEAHMRMYMYGEAAADYVSCLEEGGDEMKNRTQLGVALRFMGQYQEASQEVRSCVCVSVCICMYVCAGRSFALLSWSSITKMNTNIHTFLHTYVHTG